MSEPFVGQVIPVAFNFAPTGWLLCDGSLQPISNYEVLYQLIGTTYGGNGQTTFAVPDLRGRVIIGAGQGTGLQPYVMGQMAGAENVTLNSGQIAAHTHALMAAAAATSPDPSASVVLAATATENIYATAGASTTLNSGSIGPSPGGAQPHENRQPFTTVNYIIAWAGIYPA